MVRLDSNISAAQGSLQETPEVLYALSVNMPANVLSRMVHNFVDEFKLASAPLVRAGIVGVELAAGERCSSGLRLGEYRAGHLEQL